jgi:hypothetical protein
VPHGQLDRSLRPYSRLYRQEPLLFLSSSSSTVLMKLSGSRLYSTNMEDKERDGVTAIFFRDCRFLRVRKGNTRKFHYRSVTVCDEVLLV